MKKLFRLSVMILCMILTGCLFPSKMNTIIQINKDYTCEINLDGEFVMLLAQAEIIEKGSLSKGTDQQLVSATKEIQKDKNVKSVSYIGNGRYKIVYDLKSTLKDKSVITLPKGDMGIITINRSGNDINLTFKNLDGKKGKNDLDKLKLENLDWNVTLKTEGKVVDTNATSKPLLGLGNYGWKVSNIHQAMPYAKIQM